MVWVLIGLLIIGALYIGIADCNQSRTGCIALARFRPCLTCFLAMGWLEWAGLVGRHRPRAGSTTGLADEFATGGHYRFTCNPQ